MHRFSVYQSWFFYVALLCLGLWTCGLFLSARALMSIGMMGFAGSVLLMPNLKERFSQFKQDKTALLLMATTLLPALSYFWSINYAYWLERMQIMAPILVLPAVFSLFKPPHQRWVLWWKQLWIVGCLFGMTYSISLYLQHREAIDASYGFAKHMPTPFKNDHIRFSLAVCIGIFFGVELFFQQKQKLYLLPVAMDIVYLHWLSAKSGLLAFYGLAALFLVYLLSQKQYRTWALGGLVGLILIPIIMYQVSTPFKNKIGYVMYSLNEMKNADAQAQISDEGRLISYQFAVREIKKHPLSGVGLGDVYDTMQAAYRERFSTAEGLSLLPHNQFLMSAMAAGIFTIPLWLWALLGLAFEPGKGKIVRRFFWVLTFFAMMIEPLFETQYGVSVFLMVGLLLRPNYALSASD